MGIMEKLMSVIGESEMLKAGEFFTKNLEEIRTNTEALVAKQTLIDIKTDAIRRDLQVLNNNLKEVYRAQKGLLDLLQKTATVVGVMDPQTAEKPLAALASPAAGVVITWPGERNADEHNDDDTAA